MIAGSGVVRWSPMPHSLPLFANWFAVVESAWAAFVARDCFVSRAAEATELEVGRRLYLSGGEAQDEGVAPEKDRTGLDLRRTGYHGP